MSNEYRDWCWDTAQDYLLENNYLAIIDHFTKWDDGFLAIGRLQEGTQIAYFVWLDDLDGWSHRQVYI